MSLAATRWSDAQWRFGRYALWLIATIYLAVILITWVKAYARTQYHLKPMVMEFTPTYGASLQLRELPAHTLYEPESMLAYTKRTLPEMYPGLDPIWRDNVRYPPWLYPPHFIFLVLPLASMPYWWAYLVWNVASALPYLAAMRRILPGRLALPVALAFPPVFYNALQAQTGFLTAGLIGLGLASVRRAPLLAGICIGVASIKPHFGLLIPLALVAGGHLRVFGIATLTVLSLIGVSIAAFDLSAWTAFLSSASTNLQGFEQATYNFVPMTTVLSMFALGGAELHLGRWAQFVAFLAMTLLIGAMWWRGRGHHEVFGLQCAALCIATPLAVPMAYIYDLVILAPAVAWLGVDMRKHYATPQEWAVLIVSSIALMGIVTLAHSFSLQGGPIILLALLLLTVHRFRLGLLRRDMDITRCETSAGI